MFCGNCGTNNLDGAAFCALCGTPLPKGETAAQDSNATIMPDQPAYDNNATIMPDQNGFYQSYGQNYNQANAQYGYQPGMDIHGQSNGNNGYNNFYQPPKKKFPVLPVAIGGGVVAALVLMMVFLGSSVTNSFMKTFTSPKKYFAYVEKQEMKEIISTGENIYDGYRSALGDPTDRSVEMSLGCELGPEGKQLLSYAGAAGVDLSWLASFHVSGSFVSNDQKLEGSAAIGMNKDQNIISGDVIMDFSNMMAYLCIPELNSNYLAIDTTMFGGSYGYGYSNQYEQKQMVDSVYDRVSDLTKGLPKGSEWAKVAAPYVEIYAENIGQVEKEKDELEINDVEMKVTALTAEISPRDMQNIQMEMLKYFMKDRQFKKLFFDTFTEDYLKQMDFYETDPEEIYKEMIESATSELEWLEGYEKSDDGIVFTMTVYVDGKGDIVGRTIKEGYQTVSWQMTTKSNKFGFKCNYFDGYSDVSVYGGGKKSMEKYTGDFQLRVNGMPVLEFATEDFDWNAAKKGNIKGTLEFSLPSVIIDEAESEFYYGTGYYLGNFVDLSDIKFKADLDITPNGGSVALTVGGDKKEYVTVTSSAKVGKGKISVPKKTYDVKSSEDMIGYVSSCNFNAITKKLEKIGVPSSLTRYMDMIPGQLYALFY